MKQGFLTQKTLYLLLLVIGSNFLMFKKCGNTSPAPSPFIQPSGQNPTPPPIRIPITEINNHLTHMGQNGIVGGVSCLYSESISQTIQINVMYLDGSGMQQVYDTKNFTQNSLSSSAGLVSLDVSGLKVPTDGQFWFVAFVTMDCTVCCDKNVLATAGISDTIFVGVDGCDFNPQSPPPPPNSSKSWGKPQFTLASQTYTGNASTYVDDQNNAITDFIWGVKSFKCICSC